MENINEIGYNKLVFGYTLNGHDGSHYGGICYNYGSIRGCDENCPALLNLECEVWQDNLEYIDEELIEHYKKNNK